MNMIQITMSYLWPGIIVCISYLIIVMFAIRRKKEKISWNHLILLFTLAIYLTIIFSVTVSPVYGFSFKILKFDKVNLIPFQVIKTIYSNPLNFFGNIIMFIPFGCLLVLLSKKYQKIYVTILAGANLSSQIEVLQLFGSRSTDIDDIILNTFGTICGYCIGIILKKKNRRKSHNETGSIRVLIMIMLITVITSGFFKMKEYSKTPVKDIDINSEADINPPAINISIYARNAYLWDVETDIVLYQKESNEQIAPASTTKMLTALTVLDYCDPDEEVVVGEEIYLIANDASRIWLSVGEQLTVKQLLDGLLLPSGSDAAYALAVYAGRKISANSDISMQDAITTFIAAMNEKTISIGAKHSNFINPDGYDADNQYTTAYDLAHIAKKFMEDTVLSDIAFSLSIRDVWLNGKDVMYMNTNQLINPESSYYCKDVIGLKTGTTEQAGNCLVSAAKMNGKIYICVVMDSSEEGRWLDSLNLYHSIKP